MKALEQQKRTAAQRARLHLLASKEVTSETALASARRLHLAAEALLAEPSSQQAIREGKQALFDVFIGKYPCTSSGILTCLIAEASFFVKLSKELKHSEL